jgi:RNA polymerase sigma-70 factor (ECF subfamily)
MTGFPDDFFTPRIMTDPEAGPEKQTVQTTVLETLRRAIDEELTDKQRQALVSLKVQGMPLAEVARRMDSNRNAMYKLVYDARQKLKQVLLDKGLSPEEIMAAFE